MPLYTPRLPLVGSGQTVVTSQPLLDLTQTWNDGAVTFVGLKVNFTSTASAAGSLILDLQVGAASQFKVTKAGVLTAAGAVTTGGVLTTVGGGVTLASSYHLLLNGPAGQIRFGSSADVVLSRNAAAILQFGEADAAAPIAYTLKAQSVVTGTADTAGANFTISGSQGTGTGVGGSLLFRTAPAGGAGSSQNALVTALTINSAGLATFVAGVTMAGALAGVTTAALSGSLTYSTASAGSILKRGANGRVGTFTLNGATPVNVSNTLIAITDGIGISLQNVNGGTVGVHPGILTITDSTGFTVAGTALDVGIYNYWIVKNQA